MLQHTLVYLHVVQIGMLLVYSIGRIGILYVYIIIFMRCYLPVYLLVALHNVSLT